MAGVGAAACSPTAVGRECAVGLHLFHFSAQHYALCSALCAGFFLAAWAAWQGLVVRCRTQQQVTAASAVIIAAWASAWFHLMPRTPYW